VIRTRGGRADFHHEPTSYTWNARNQLVGLSGGASANFAYDGVGRRRGKTIGGTTTDFLWDEFNLVQELTANETPIANLPMASAVDEILLRIDGAGASTLLADGIGSTLALADAAGTVQTQDAYEPFGATTTSGAASTNAAQFTGRENDGTGLYYYRARYYSPQLGRFVSEDPLEFGGGSTNLYASANGNPISISDPLGLWGLFGFGSVTGETPGPVRGAVEGIALGGYDSNSGWYAGDIGAAGVEVGGQQNYGAYFVGAESTTACRKPRKIKLKEISLGPEVPFLAGLGIGGGRYSTDEESGFFFFVSGGAIGEHGALGFGFPTSTSGSSCGCR
jgi:RHS repeat-associated protein